LSINNVTFENVEPFKYAALTLFNVQLSKLNGITIRNYKGSRNPIYPIIALSHQPLKSVEIENLVFENSDLSKQSLFIGTTVYRSFTMKNMLFSNLTLSADSILMRIVGFHEFSMENTTFSHVISSDPTDDSSIILHVDFIQLGTLNPVLFSNIRYENSSVTLFKFFNFAPAPLFTKNFIFENMNFTNCLISRSMSIISLKKLESQLGLVFIFNNLWFDNIEFVSKGHLMELSQQFPVNVTIYDSTFTNIKSGSILIASSNLQNTVLTTNVNILNSTADNIGQVSSSFIEIKEGGRLVING